VPAALPRVSETGRRIAGKHRNDAGRDERDAQARRSDPGEDERDGARQAAAAQVPVPRGDDEPGAGRHGDDRRHARGADLEQHGGDGERQEAQVDEPLPFAFRAAAGHEPEHHGEREERRHGDRRAIDGAPEETLPERSGLGDAVDPVLDEPGIEHGVRTSQALRKREGEADSERGAGADAQGEAEPD